MLSSVLFSCCILFCSLLFCSLLFCSILVYSLLFSSLLLFSVLYYSILFYSVVFYFVLLLYSILFCSFLFYSIMSYSILFYSILLYSVVFCSVPTQLSSNARISVWPIVWMTTYWTMSALPVQNCIPVLLTPTEVREYVFKRQMKSYVNADLAKRWMHVLHHVLFGSIDCHQAVTVSFPTFISFSCYSVLLHAPRVLASGSHFCPEAGLRSATFPKQAFFTYFTFRSRFEWRPEAGKQLQFCPLFRVHRSVPTTLTRIENCSFDRRNENFPFYRTSEHFL